jgi:hypothetical protein
MTIKVNFIFTKRKKINMIKFLKVVIPIVLSSLVIVGVFLFKIYTKPSISQKRSDGSFCNLLQDNLAVFCRSCVNKFKSPDLYAIAHCTARTAIKEINEEAAREVCSKLEELSQQKLCFAFALAEINSSSALNQCQQIEELEIREFCISEIRKIS